MEQGRISFRPEIIEMLSRIYQVRLTVSVMDWNIVLKKVEEAFGELNEADRFFRAMENLTGVGSYQVSTRYLIDIENDGQAPSFQILYTIVRILNISINQYIHMEKTTHQSTLRRNVYAMLDNLDERDLVIIKRTITGILLRDK